jgi:hypothetical protein
MNKLKQTDISASPMITIEKGLKREITINQRQKIEKREHVDLIRDK